MASLTPAEIAAYSSEDYEGTYEKEARKVTKMGPTRVDPTRTKEARVSSEQKRYTAEQRVSKKAKNKKNNQAEALKNKKAYAAKKYGDDDKRRTHEFK